jgi:hypothetical protein
LLLEYYLATSLRAPGAPFLPWCCKDTKVAETHGPPSARRAA